MRARQAFMDAIESGERFTVAAYDAIETATRVKITDEVIDAAERASAHIFNGRRQRIAAIKAALIELGFEVEE